MKIRKVDDKPMVIHTKEKAKIHAHEPKGAKIKGSNIYTVERGPKTAGAKVTNTDRKKSYRKSTIHQSESKNKGLSRFKRNYRESNTSIKTKNTNLHIAGRTGALAAGAVTEHVEGGQEVSQAAYLAYEASRPVTGTASKGAALFRKKAAAEAKKRIKKVDAGKKLAKKTAKKAAKDTAKTVAKETAKETAKTTAKVAAKTASKTAATAAGTAVAPGVGTAIGIAAGYAAGVSIEVKDEKMTNRSRKIKFFLDKMKAQENQTDSVAKLVKDLIVRKAITWVKAAAPIVGLVLLLLVLVVAMIAVPVIAVIAILYNSPFALFLPPLESGDTVQTVTSAYVQEFNRDVNTKVNEHTGYDLGELVYVDYEGMEENPSNYYDIMAVYMVKHGVGDTATVMNDTSKGWLQAVVNDMCSYTTSTGRTVLHLYVPDNPNAYYQELGRGGRDGLPCLSVMCVYPDEDLESAFVMTDKVLGSDKILGRWDSMLNSHTSARGIDYCTLDTSVKPNYNSVDYAEDTSTVDQKWNIYVILLLRRYNLIKILDMVVDPKTQVYFIRVSILDKRLLQITDQTKALIEEVRAKEWTKNEKDFKTMSRAVKQGKRMCWSEMFFNSTYSMVSEYCAGCDNHKNIVDSDPMRFELVKKVPAPTRKFSVELDNMFASSNEAILFSDIDNTELIGRVINRGFSTVIINDEEQSSYFNLLNSISEWMDVNLLGMNEFMRLVEHGDYYYFAGDAVVLYGNTEQDIYKKLRRLRKALGTREVRLLHVFREDIYCNEVNKTVSSIVDGPVIEEYLIERM